MAQPDLRQSGRLQSSSGQPPSRFFGNFRESRPALPRKNCLSGATEENNVRRITLIGSGPTFEMIDSRRRQVNNRSVTPESFAACSNSLGRRAAATGWHGAPTLPCARELKCFF